ncbi:MAG: peptide-methionine (S)-S-oxide reductase MsrA [Candidatus Thermoplasmatota archaeon]
MEKATFGAGCFWHVEEAFRHLNGVLSTTVGYTGGTTKNPTYEEVCTDKTGHAEVVEITYDPQKITYVELLRVFWDIHDPTTKNRQGPDIGTQYRSAIFYHSPEQKTAAELSKKTLEQTKKYKKKIVTEITQATPFYPAEEYHQRYFEKHGIAACPR